jgi:hypothetical protein
LLALVVAKEKPALEEERFSPSLPLSLFLSFSLSLFLSFSLSLVL